MRERERVLADATLHDRFWEKVDVRGNDECWNWMAGRSSNRYGCIKVGGKKGKDLKAHRVQMIWQGVEIDGKVVRHRCDNPMCVNPKHLEVGTQYDNIQDMMQRNRNNQPSGEWNGMAKLSSSAVRQIRERLRDGETVSSIARSLNANHLLIYNIAVRKTYPKVAEDVVYAQPSLLGSCNPNSKASDEDVAAMRRCYMEVKSYNEVARRFGVSRLLAMRCITGKRWNRVVLGESPIPNRSGPRQQIASRKLSDDQVREILAIPRNGEGCMTRPDIAAKYGISTSLVDGIRSGKFYSWVK